MVDCTRSSPPPSIYALKHVDGVHAAEECIVGVFPRLIASTVEAAAAAVC